MHDSVLLVFLLIMTIFLGIELIYKVPSTLHTPLMSATNAISGITLIGALVPAGNGSNLITTILGFAAVTLATIDVVGGFLVTNRMLKMFYIQKQDK